MEALKFYQQPPLGSGYGSGYGDGSGSGYGYGYGYGSGYGSGYGDGSGYGSGYGDGSGSGYGYGYGDGSGYGSGYGDGDGDGYGYGYGYGIKSINNQKIDYIDGVPTAICSVRGNLAKGFTIDLGDFSQAPCFVARSGYTYAHGNTGREAVDALQAKLIAQMSTDERIDEFKRLKLDPKKRHPAKLFFDWHGRLTGSCQSGREAFARFYDINIESDAMTVSEFIELTKNAYGHEIIERLNL